MHGCKAKKFQDRMSHRGSGKAVGEKKIAKGLHGTTVGESAMHKQYKPLNLTAKMYPHKQSSDGNGGQ